MGGGNYLVLRLGREVRWVALRLGNVGLVFISTVRLSWVMLS